MTTGTDQDTGAAARLWSAYGASRDAGLREQLVSLYLPFARIMAAKLYAVRTHANVEFDDYLQYARVGLLESIERFDAGRGYKFETYAASRINGAILSGMEVYSEVHEQVAARRRAVQARVAALAEPERPVASPADLFSYLAELAVGLAVGFALEHSGMYQSAEQEAHYRDYTYAGVELKQLQERIKALLEELPGKHRQVVNGHYLQQLPFHEIAETMQLTRGRIAQLHKEALLKLREALRSTRDLDWSG